MSKFIKSQDFAANGRDVWTRGDDTCDNPYLELHAPHDRVAAPDKWLLYFVQPNERQFATFKQRGMWLAFKSRQAAMRYVRRITK
jgi:hypothetical protein